jgi:plasmid stability protein
MTLIIEIPDELATALKAKAQAEGLSADSYAHRVLQQTLVAKAEPPAPRKPLETGYGMFAKYGPAPTGEEIDENRRDMLRGSVFG